MNERITKLAEQAGFKLIRENCYDIVSTMTEQEFAELIVRECAEWVNDNLGLVDEEARKDLLRHFGVE